MAGFAERQNTMNVEAEVAALGDDRLPRVHGKPGAGAGDIRGTAVVIRPLDCCRGVDSVPRAQEDSQDPGAARVDLPPTGLGNGQVHQAAVVDVAVGAVGVVNVDREESHGPTR